MLIALVSILIFARIVSPRISLLAAGNTTVSLFVYKYSLLLLLIIAELSGRHRQSTIVLHGWGGSKSWYQGHTQHRTCRHSLKPCLHISLDLFIYLFIYLGLLIPVFFFENRGTKKCQSLALIVNLMALVT